MAYYFEAHQSDFLCGYINGADYTGNDYKFDENGQLTVCFPSDSYVYVRSGSREFWTNGWLGNVTSAVLYETGSQNPWVFDKLLVPGCVEVTFRLTHNPDDTVTLAYTARHPSTMTADRLQNGVTLHCWNWSFREIAKHLDLIVGQGFTAVQTSPIQPLKEYTISSFRPATDPATVAKHWWVYYQPVDFVINTNQGNALGTKKDLKYLISEAHRRNVQVIVDVVCNHLGNKGGNDLADLIPEHLEDTDFWHNLSENIKDYNDRFQVTQQCMGGLPDLDTSSKELQIYVLKFLMECIDLGVDGFRFDAAKHIETPYETPMDDADFSSDFWPTVITGAECYAWGKYGKNLYIYGELLDNIGIALDKAYTRYMAVTDNSWGNDLLQSIVAGTADLEARYHRAVSGDVLVVWAESHDTYAEHVAREVEAAKAGRPWEKHVIAEADVIKTWALVAARADTMALYLARPQDYNQPLGVASKTGWLSAEARAVNQFNNRFVEKAEEVGNENGVSYVARGGCGVVLVQAEQQGKKPLITHTLSDGRYLERIANKTFGVKDGTISDSRDNTIAHSGIAVLTRIDTPSTL